MSDTGDSTTSDTGGTGDSQTLSDTGESSVFSDWSVVDEHGDLPDDETTSTTSSVEIVEEDDPDDCQSTPIVGSPAGVAPRFILRLPSHEQASDTDEDPAEDNSSGSSSAARDSMEVVSKSTSSIASKQSSPAACVSRSELDELRQTLDTLKRNLQPSYADDSSLSSAEMFGDGKSDTKGVKTGGDEQPQSFGMVENIGVHGNMLNGDVSLESSVSSSYSFLSRDAGTECSLLRDRSESQDRVSNVEEKSEQQGDLSEPMNSNPELGTSRSNSQNEIEEEQPGTTTLEPPATTVHGNPLRAFVSLLTSYPVEYLFLVGLASYTGVLILAVLYIQGPGPVPAYQGEDMLLNRCLQNTHDLQTKLEIYRNGYYDNDNINRKKFESLLAEKEEIFASKLKDKEVDILELQNQLYALLDEKNADKSAEIECKKVEEKQTDLQNENEKLRKALDESSQLNKQDVEEWKTHSNNVLQLCVKEKEDNQRQTERDLDGVRSQCHADLDKVKSQSQGDTDKIKAQCQADVQKVKVQCQNDLDKIRNQCQSDLDTLKAQTETKDKYARGQCDRGMKPAQDQGLSQFEDENGESTQPVNAKKTESAKTVDDKDASGTRSKDGKEPLDAQSESNRKSKKKENQSKSRERNKQSSGGSKRNKKKPDDEQTQFNKGDDSHEYSDERGNSAFNWADTVMELMNKTREQIQDTWEKVKNMSENLWQEHQPALLHLQNSFSQKLQHLGKKFQGKFARKMNKWFKKFNKKHAQQDDGHTANTKRRQYTGDDDVTGSNHTVGERLVKLSHEVEALNAKKFKKWRAFPKVLDIQREFEQMKVLVKAGQSGKDQQQESELSDFMSWFDCQYRWWKNLNLVTVTDDCYLSLCCWQVKVTGGDVKQCRKTKRKQRIAANTCSLELTTEPLTPDRGNNGDGQHMNTKTDSANKFQKKDQIHQKQYSDSAQTSDREPEGNDEENWFLTRGEERGFQRDEPDDWFFRRKHRRDANQEPESTDEENWFLEMGKDREYHREEPDNWFFRRKQNREAQHRKSMYSMEDEDNWEDDGEYDSNYKNCDL